jgi:hypothetical protein
MAGPNNFYPPKGFPIPASNIYQVNNMNGMRYDDHIPENILAV